MNTIRELLLLLEKADLVNIEGLFKDADVQIFKKKKLYDARAAVPEEELQITANGKAKRSIKAKDGQWVVRDHSNVNVVDLLNAKDFSTRFEKVRPNQKPDAEGFTVWCEAGEFEAFKYDGDDAAFKNMRGQHQPLKSGDWIVKDKSLDAMFIAPAAMFNDTFQKV